ncbi:hypothetical protein KJ641_00980 [Patescibacteria group bacterium]|nr:hypothetical protein [Patescibacteria group bacterium]
MTLKFKLLLTILAVGIIITTLFVLRNFFDWSTKAESVDPMSKVEDYLEERLLERTEAGSDEDIFGDDNIVKILLVGIDSRAGQTSGHCDAIQFFEINRKKNTVKITAVPRGTYSPLPWGTGVTSSDYYVSNACGLGGLRYGVTQIERVLGDQADYVVVVGFSGAMGIVRSLQLPATETLQWLRHRQGYAIGEPQRARNHSTFLKELMVKYLPENSSTFDSAWQYLIYKLVKTDLSFSSTQDIVSALSTMELNSYPERITLSMRPAYEVQDIVYDPETVGEYLHTMIDPIKHLLNPKDYQDIDQETAQERLLEMISDSLDDEVFIRWAFENYLWYQIDDSNARMQVQYDLMEKYSDLILDETKKQEIVADYILEMGYLEEEKWQNKGKKLLLGQTL